MFRFHISGKRACFPRPEFTGDRISYDVVPPYTARGIIEAIYWSPAIRWHIDRLLILNAINLETIVSPATGVRQADLIDVAYVVEAQFTLTSSAGPRDHPAQHVSLIRRRAKKEQFYRIPFLGLCEYPAQVRLLSASEPVPTSALSGGELDLGWMENDLNNATPPRMKWFQAVALGGWIDTTCASID